MMPMQYTKLNTVLVQDYAVHRKHVLTVLCNRFYLTKMIHQH